MHDSSCCSRRHFLAAGGFSLGTLGLATLLERDGLLAAAETPGKPAFEEREFDLKPKAAHFAPAQCDDFALHRRRAEPPRPVRPQADAHEIRRQALSRRRDSFDNAGDASDLLMASPFKFEKHGQSGIEMSELLPHIAEIADDIVPDPLDEPLRHPQPRRRHEGVDDRPRHGRTPDARQLVDLRPGQRDAGPARLCRAGRPQGSARLALLVERLAAVGLSRARTFASRSRAS